MSDEKKSEVTSGSPESTTPPENTTELTEGSLQETVGGVKVQVQDMVIMKRVDKSSPNLF